MLYVVLFLLFLNVTPENLEPHNIIKDNQGRYYKNYKGVALNETSSVMFPIAFYYQPTLIDTNVNSFGTSCFSLLYFKNNNFNTIYGFFRSPKLVNTSSEVLHAYTPISTDVASFSFIDPRFVQKKMCSPLVIEDLGNNKTYTHEANAITESGFVYYQYLGEIQTPTYVQNYKQYIREAYLDQILLIDNIGNLYYTGYSVSHSQPTTSATPEQVTWFPHKIEKLYLVSYETNLYMLVYKEKISKKNYMLFFDSRYISNNYYYEDYPRILELPFKEDIIDYFHLEDAFCFLTQSGKVYCSLYNTRRVTNDGIYDPNLIQIPHTTPIKKVGILTKGSVVFLDQNNNMFLFGENMFYNIKYPRNKMMEKPLLLENKVEDFVTQYSKESYPLLIYKKNNSLYNAFDYNIIRIFDETRNDYRYTITGDSTSYIRVPHFNKNSTIYNCIFLYNNLIFKNKKTKDLFYVSKYNGFSSATGAISNNFLERVNVPDHNLLSLFDVEETGAKRIFLHSFRSNIIKTNINIKKTATSYNTIYYLDGENKLWLFGSNQYYQFGNGTNNDSYDNAILYPISNIVDFVTSYYAYTIIALDRDGNVWCSGYNGVYNCGQGNTATVTTPVRVKTGPSSYLENVKKIFSVAKHTLCALKQDDTFWCWGQNSSGQLCMGNYNNVPYATQITFTIDDQPRTVIEAYGEMCNSCYTSYYLLDNNKVYACGDNTIGIMGTGGTEPAYNTPQEVPLPDDGVYSLSIADDNVCYVDSSKNAWCVGQDRGHFSSIFGITYNDNPITPMGSEYNTKKIKTTKDAMCFITNNGKLMCSGPNPYGLGFFCNGFSCDSGIQEPIRDVSFGERHACALAASGKIYCWGNNKYGQLGNGTLTNSSNPVLVKSNAVFSFVSAGSDHTCAIDSSGAAYCWGNNQFGQLGVKGVPRSTAPIPVPIVLPYMAIYAGTSFTCSIAQGEVPTQKTIVSCWGLNNVGQLGNGNTKSSSEPVKIIESTKFGMLTLNKAKNLSLGKTHVCALLWDSTGVSRVVCWGKNVPIFNEAQIPNRFSTRPVKIYENTDPEDIVGNDKTLCIQNNAQQIIKCFGNKREISYIY